jgi:hypothetical protein
MSLGGGLHARANAVHATRAYYLDLVDLITRRAATYCAGRRRRKITSVDAGRAVSDCGIRRYGTMSAHAERKVKALSKKNKKHESE